MAFGRPTKYPWDQWFKRRTYELMRGSDFDCQPYAMAQQIRNRARKLGVSVHISISEDVVKVINHA